MEGARWVGIFQGVEVADDRRVHSLLVSDFIAFTVNIRARSVTGAAANALAAAWR